MLTRFIIVLLAAGLSASGAQASGKGDPKTSGPSHLELAAIGLPVIVGGKIKNYVFVQVQLLPTPGADLIKLREKEPYYRDALMRAAHRAPFNSAADWTQLDERRLEATLLAEARRISGPKSFQAAELLKQTPRRRTGMLQARAAR
jgi:hypothetical protein